MRKFTLLLFFVVLWSFSYAQMGEEQYFVDIHGDLRYESRDRFQASLSTNIFGDKVYKDNRGSIRRQCGRRCRGRIDLILKIFCSLS